MIIAPKATIDITSTNIAQIEAGVAVYNSANTYAANETVQINGTINRKYKATQNVPANTNPLNDVNPTTGRGTYWFDAGATNYMRAFDELGSSKCENAELINFKFTTSDIDVLMLQGLESKTVRIKIVNEDNAIVLLDETFESYTREAYDWFDWTYATPEYQTSFFKILPMAFNTSMEIWIENTNSTAAVGHITFGRSKNYGLSLIDPQPVSSRRGVTSKTRDEFGNITTRRKARYRRMTITCLIDSSSVDIIEDRLDAIVDTPSIFVGDERDGGYKALLIYGEMKDHDMPIDVSKTTYQLEVEGYL